MAIVPRDIYAPITGGHRLLLELDYPDDYMRAFGVAMRLALDLPTCIDLLEGVPVDPCRLDQRELARSRERRLVQLVAPIDLLERARRAA